MWIISDLKLLVCFPGVHANSGNLILFKMFQFSRPNLPYCRSHIFGYKIRANFYVLLHLFAQLLGKDWDLILHDRMWAVFKEKAKISKKV